MRVLSGVLCLVLVASSTWPRDLTVDASLPTYRSVAGVAGVIRCHGSAGMGELMTLWAKGFQRYYPSFRVELDDAAFEDVGDGAATFGPRLGVTRLRTLKRFKKRFGHAPTQIAVCLYVLAVYVHKDSPCRGGLRMEDVETIFSSHFWDVTWGDLGCKGEWSKRTISLYAPRRLTALVLLSWRTGRLFGFKHSVNLLPRDAGVVSSVEDDTRGMGLALSSCLTEKVRTLAIAPSGTSKFALPTAENAGNGSYPLTGAFYLALNHDPEAGVELDVPRREFLRYILSKDGQEAVVKAGYVPLTAELAKRALAGCGLVPSGAGSPWDSMISRLRARRLAPKRMGRIVRLARKIGGKPTYEQLADLAKLLAGTGLTSSVTFEIKGKGARVRYYPVGHSGITPTVEATKDAKVTVPIGLYHVWTERDGTATSPKEAWFQVIREQERIRIYENR